MKNAATLLGAMFALFVIMATGCGGDNYDQHVLSVREGTFHMNPNVPVGKAFDQFFANGKWKSFISTENERIVEFNGECSWYNAPADMKIQFNVDGKSFILRYVDINGVQMDFLDSTAIVEKVLSEYKP